MAMLISNGQSNRDQPAMSATTPSSKAKRHDSPSESGDFKTRLIEGSPDCIKVLDLDGRLLSMNAGGMAVLRSAI